MNETKCSCVVPHDDDLLLLLPGVAPAGRDLVLVVPVIVCCDQQVWEQRVGVSCGTGCPPVCLAHASHLIRLITDKSMSCGHKKRRFE